ncbi:methylmalonyl-CoA epimerase [Oceanobacillus manasiensis]|uniref:methylmalonyl-CoA epimerase n=1 Tax=Oceanobacillus manasiensis TaxID=586413 RepID=UPI000ABDADCB|nr:methylmalonyl-CoA epimerase [Oceanobacillus manasiensis]
MELFSDTAMSLDSALLPLPKISHIGIAVKCIKMVLPFYIENFGLRMESLEIVPSEDVKVAILVAENIQIELLEPNSPDSPLAAYINKYGEGLHHIAFETDSIEKKLMDLKANGVSLVNNVVKGGARNSKIIFIHPKAGNGTLIEVCEYVGRENNEHI